MKRPMNTLGLAAFLLILLGLAAAGPAPAAPAGAAGMPRGSAPQSTLADLTRKEPYLLYAGDPTQMRVLWQLTATDTARIEWGTDTSYVLGSVQTSEYGADHQHAYTLTGLTPGTRYYFRVTNEGVPHRGSFTAAPDPAATRLKFLAYGDTRSYPATHNQVAGAMISTFTADPEYQTLSVFVGDAVYYGDNETYWTNEFFSPAYANIRRLMASVPLAMCMGNHEQTGALFVKYFPYPFAAARYWSFDYGPAHFTVVDQYTSYTSGSPQLQWIANDLAGTSKLWKFVVLHEPGWSAWGGHPNNTTVQTVLELLFEQYGVAIVFGGHNHYYARAAVNGVQHVTTGGGGAPLHVPDLFQPNIVTAWRDYHFCKIAIDGATLRLQAFATTSGTVVDSFTLVRAIPDTQPPSVTVTSPVGGEEWAMGSLRAISWTATDNVGVDSVDVDYSPSGPPGPWLPVAHGVANSGSLPWTVPGPPTDSALVRVTAYDHALNAGSDASDSLFRIADPNAGVGDGVPAGLALARPLPNPGRSTTLLGFSLPHAGPMRLEIRDLSGRRIWQAERQLPAGAHAWHWDGRTDAGARAGAGLYFVRLVTPWGIRTQRLAWLR